jgi:hypothetical protein
MTYQSIAGTLSSDGSRLGTQLLGSVYARAYSVNRPAGPTRPRVPIPWPPAAEIVTPRPTRDYVDAAGVSWRVSERPGTTGPTLVFMSVSVIRRVASYPADWWMLPVADLIRLSWTR